MLDMPPKAEWAIFSDSFVRAFDPFFWSFGGFSVLLDIPTPNNGFDSACFDFSTTANLATWVAVEPWEKGVGASFAIGGNAAFIFPPVDEVDDALVTPVFCENGTGACFDMGGKDAGEASGSGTFAPSLAKFEDNFDLVADASPRFFVSIALSICSGVVPNWRSASRFPSDAWISVTLGCKDNSMLLTLAWSISIVFQSERPLVSCNGENSSFPV
mmetsp:Transcript_22329/g.34404  ORF Transcript_22329/g.34404 Transcript_22329/m.34404 type:complete len:215 (+) Transcript_22329:328-972(+)